MKDQGVLYDGLRVLGGGSILGGLILGAIAVFIIDRNFMKASGFALAGALLDVLRLHARRTDRHRADADRGRELSGHLRHLRRLRQVRDGDRKTGRESPGTARRRVSGAGVTPVGPSHASRVLLAVNGTLMRGLDLNPTLLAVDGRWFATQRPSLAYRLWSMNDRYPAMVRVSSGGAPVAVEVWSVPAGAVAFILENEPDGPDDWQGEAGRRIGGAGRARRAGRLRRPERDYGVRRMASLHRHPGRIGSRDVRCVSRHSFIHLGRPCTNSCAGL